MATLDLDYAREIVKEGASDKLAADKLAALRDWEQILRSSSYGHEYARLQLDKLEGEDFVKREEMLTKMETCKRAYFLARRYLRKETPERLEALESELRVQKTQIFGFYSA